MRKKTVSLVLSSGGARGVAHIAVIEELEKQGFEIKTIAGSSIGAAIGGIYAAGKLKEYKKWVRNLDKLGVFKLMDFTLSTLGFIKGYKVINELRKFIGDPDIENLPIDLTIVAADIMNFKEVVFTKGNMFEAIHASASIPSIFEPYKYKKTYLVDGGIVNPLPLDKVQKYNNDLVIAVNLNAEIPYKKPVFNKKKQTEKKNAYKKQLSLFYSQWHKIFTTTKEEKKKPGYFSLMNRTFEIMQNKLTKISIMEYKPDIIINLSRHAASTFEFYRAEEMLKVGTEITRKALKDSGLNKT